jgi:RNase P/RNase MRP subunit p30
VNIPGLIYDSLGFVDTVEKVRKLQRKYNAKIIFGHDAKQFSELKLAPEFYE